jgi:hypothetical protein
MQEFVVLSHILLSSFHCSDQVLDDELYARMLQDELFVQELQADPDFDEIFSGRDLKVKLRRERDQTILHFNQSINHPEFRNTGTQTRSQQQQQQQQQQQRTPRVVLPRQPRSSTAPVSAQPEETDFIDDLKKIGDGMEMDRDRNRNRREK